MRITIILTLINILMFLYTLPNLDYYITEFGFSAKNFLSGKYEIVGTAMFLHANIFHLIFNMTALLLLGNSLEQEVENWKYLLVYLLSGLIGNLAMLIPFLFSPETIGVGASGAISGLVGLGTFLCPGKLVIFPSVIPLPFVVAGALYFLSTAMNLFLPSQIAYPVHFVGMIVGSIFGLMWSNQKTKRILIFVTTLLLIVLLPHLLKIVL